LSLWEEFVGSFSDIDAPENYILIFK
jgi:hypothetical protein